MPCSGNAAPGRVGGTQPSVNEVSKVENRVRLDVDGIAVENDGLKWSGNVR
jgi:hypothetical protein